MNIAVVCDYKLMQQRIGGMDYFFISFNRKAEENGYKVTWFFKDYNSFDFYKEMEIYSSKGFKSVETLFIHHLLQYPNKYDFLITHFTQICSRFYKDAKLSGNFKGIFAVDHNARPSQGFTYKKRVKNIIKSFLYQKYIKKFIAVSPYSKKHLIKDFGLLIKSKIEIINNGLDVAQIDLKTEKRTSTKFMVSCHITKGKGIQFLLNSVNSLKNKGCIGFTIDIYGDGPELNSFKDFVNKNNLFDLIDFKGNTNQILSLYKNYDYLIHPSSGETFGYSIIESLIANIPVITTHESNVLGEVVDGQNGFLFTKKSKNSLENILLEIHWGIRYIDSTNYEEIRNKYSLERTTKDYIKVLNRCI